MANLVVQDTRFTSTMQRYSNHRDLLFRTDETLVYPTVYYKLCRLECMRWFEEERSSSQVPNTRHIVST